MKIVTKEWAQKFEEAEYLNDILDGLKEIQEKNGYTDKEMDEDLDVALWRAYVYNNMDSYDFYELSEKTLARVKDKGVKSGIWCYRYSCALVYLRRYDEALEYSRLGTEVEPDYPWGWLQLGRLCYKFNLLDEAFKAIDKGLELVPNDYEFLTLKDDIENDRGYAYTNSHYINEETDKNSQDRLISIDDERAYNEFLNKSELEKRLDILHKEDKNQEIIDIITSLPKEELNYIILGKLARAYNNNDQYEKGLEVLLSLKEEGEKDSLWNFRAGYSCYYLGKLEEAESYFKKALEINPNEPDAEMLLRYTYSDLGNRKFEEGDNEGGIDFYKKMLDTIKNDRDLIYVKSELAWAYDHIGEYENSLQCLDEVTKLGRDDIWVHSELGFCLGGLKRFDQAILEFEKAIEMGRADEWVFERLAVCYREIENYDKALENYEKALEIEPDEIYVISELAWIYDNVKNDTAKGLEYLQRAKELGRDDIWINSEFGWVYNHSQKNQEALEFLEKAKELGREDGWIYYELGYALVRLNRVDEGLKNYLKAKELGKDDIGTNVEIGYWLNATDKSEEALPYLEKARELRGEADIWIDSELGFTFDRLKRYEDGLVYLKKAEELGRDDEWLFSELGFCLKNLENYEEALEYYLKAEEKGRADEWLNLEVGEILGELERYEEAIIRLQHLLSLEDSDKTFINSQIGYFYGRLNNAQEALKYLYEAEKLGRDDIWLYCEIGWNLADESIKKYEEALEYLDRAVKLGRDDVWINGQLGFIYSKLERYEEAITYFEKANFMDTEDSWLIYQLGSIYRKSGEVLKAIKILEDSLEKNQFKGWVELELAWCYALIDEREKAQKYLDEAHLYIEGEILNSEELKKDVENIKKLIQSMTLLS